MRRRLVVLCSLMLMLCLCLGIGDSKVMAAGKNAPEVWWDESDYGEVRVRYNMTGSYYEYNVFKLNGNIIYEGWDNYGSSTNLNDPLSSYGNNSFEKYITTSGTYSYQIGLSKTKSAADMIWSNETKKYFNLNVPKVAAPVMVGWTEEFNLIFIPSSEAMWYEYELLENNVSRLHGQLGVDASSNYYFQCRKGPNGTAIIDFDRDFTKDNVYTFRIMAKPKDAAKYIPSDYAVSIKECTVDYIKQYYPVKDLKWNLRNKSISFYPNNNGTEYKIKLVHLESETEWYLGTWGPSDGSILRTHYLNEYIAADGHYQVLIMVGDDVYDKEFTIYTPGVNASDIVLFNSKKKSFVIDNTYASQSTATSQNVTNTGFDLSGYTLVGTYAPFATVPDGKGAYVASPGTITGVDATKSIILVATLSNGTTQTTRGIIDPNNSLIVGAFNNIPVSISVFIK